MDFATSSNAMIQDNPEGLVRKNAIHIKRKNCLSRNAEEKQTYDLSHEHMGTRFGVLVSKDCSDTKMCIIEIGVKLYNICIT